MINWLERIYPAWLVLALTGIATFLSVGLTYLIFFLHDLPVSRPSQIAAIINPLLIAPPLGGSLVFLIYKLLRLDREHGWMAAHDGLTGLRNRESFIEAGEALLALAKRNQAPVTLLMVDLDHFKAVNDTYGHAAGDRLLKLFSERLKSLVRSSDVVCRYGGEEFLILLNDTGLEAASQFGEHLRQAIQDPPLMAQDDARPLTISLGVASLPLDPQDITLGGLIRKADQALYRAKRLGRDRLQIYSDIEDNSAFFAKARK